MSVLSSVASAVDRLMRRWEPNNIIVVPFGQVLPFEVGQAQVVGALTRLSRHAGQKYVGTTNGNACFQVPAKSADDSPLPVLQVPVKDLPTIVSQVKRDETTWLALKGAVTHIDFSRRLTDASYQWIGDGTSQSAIASSTIGESIDTTVGPGARISVSSALAISDGINDQFERALKDNQASVHLGNARKYASMPLSH